MKSLSPRLVLLLCLLAGMALPSCSDRPAPGAHSPTPDGEKNLEGRVIRFEGNETGDADQLILQSGDLQLSLHFPPHTAKKIMSLAPPSINVEVWVIESRSPMDRHTGYELFRIRSGAESFHVHSLRPPPPQRGQEVLISGKAGNLAMNREGQVRSFTLGGKLVTLPPHVGGSIGPALGAAKTVTVTGYQRAAGTGFVNLRGLDVVRPSAIRLDSTTYTLE